MSLTLQPPQSAVAIPGRRLARWILAAYWLLLVLGTHWPKGILPGEGRFMPGDKRLHFIAYCVLAGLLAVVLVPRQGGRSQAAACLREVFSWSLAALAIAVAVGLVDEATQPWTGRDFEWADWHADICGAVVGVAAVVGAMLLRMRKRHGAAESL